MPELPEVETMARDLAGLVTGARLLAADLALPRLLVAVPPGGLTLLAGTRIATVGRRAKRVCLTLAPDAGEHLLLVIGPGMSGSFRVEAAERPRGRHDHMELRLADGRALRFRDPRTFSRIGIYRIGPDGPRDSAGADPFARLGPEPRAGADVAALVRRLREGAGRRAIKAALLDQAVIAGVGNIYADEALFAAGIHPAARIADLSPERVERLVLALIATIEEAIAARGSTVRTYRAPAGAGSMQERLAAYGRGGLPCRRCGASLARLRVAGRGTVTCPGCCTAGAPSAVIG